MKLFKCQSYGQLLFFENRRCEKCARQLGYLPEANILSALEPDGPSSRAQARSGRAWPSNRTSFQALSDREHVLALGVSMGPHIGGTFAIWRIILRLKAAPSLASRSRR
jgi:hypothetical protein